jgi:DNA-binding LacI/PurR family transcriptional regulator/DNA-binding transcriptional regulator YhcF (GntR family)
LYYSLIQSDELADRVAEILPELPAGRLPTVRQFAARWSASTRTVQSALRELHRRGLVDSRPGSGLWRSGEVPVAMESVPRGDARSFAERLRKEIESGLHAWNRPLPAAKEWARRWSCHAQTASKALRLLEQELDLVHRHGRTYVPSPPVTSSPRGSRQRLLCIGAADPVGDLRMDSDRELDFWREVGTEAAQAGLALSRLPWSAGRISLDRSAVGVVASTWHLSEPSVLYRAMERLRLPVCIWVEDPSFRGGLSHAYPRLHFHDLGYGATAGKAVARHLLGLGHRRLAYLSPWHKSAWSKNRLRGLREEAGRAGASVETFCLEGLSEWDRLSPAWTDSRLRETFPEALLEKSVEGSAQPLRTAAIRELGWNRIRRDFEGLAQAALASEATAWIGANDAAALMAKDWLTARNVNVPGTVSVVGFDDTSAALRADLTSYRFDSASMARAMLLQILSSGTWAALSHHGGVMVPRGSSSRPKS